MMSGLLPSLYLFWQDSLRGGEDTYFTYMLYNIGRTAHRSDAWMPLLSFFIVCFACLDISPSPEKDVGQGMNAFLLHIIMRYPSCY
mmetsp:Transcript_15932/g.21780  ORF Transcript_15932/g.21780 Transcript_15932/m.21780 type:complete len:86 (+) Transcript_15932:15-272(+)